ncbi:Uncharacterised protein [Mycobacterium tuberculosis]|uniref:Uncharacterized protein n=1 Tax=Mycobacterium tuberculosis TaxID=1773 RepID=A0A0U0QTB6_MYCTX|nr:Uncharacterised protein [Mycobacterium tuberculosis]
MNTVGTAIPGKCSVRTPAQLDRFDDAGTVA